MKNSYKAFAIHFTAKGQVVIPIRLKKELEIEKGTRALEYLEGDTIVIRPITRRYIRGIRGSLKGSGVLKSLMDNRKREREVTG